MLTATGAQLSSEKCPIIGGYARLPNAVLRAATALWGRRADATPE